MMLMALLNSRLSKWAICFGSMICSSYPKRAIKGQAIIDFIADHLVPTSTKLYGGLLDEILIANVTSDDEV